MEEAVAERVFEIKVRLAAENGDHKKDQGDDGEHLPFEHDLIDIKLSFYLSNNKVN